jgi:hypothetical protein
MPALFGAAPTLGPSLRGSTAEIGSAKSDHRSDMLDRRVWSLASDDEDNAAVAAMPLRASGTDAPARVVGDTRGYSSVGATASAQPASAIASTGAPSGIDPTTSGGIADLAEHVVRLASSNQQDVTLHLHPPDLGNLTVRVAVAGREVAAWFASPLASVQQAIGQAIGQLGASLSNAGYTLGSAWVGADTSGRSSDGQYRAAAPRRIIAGTDGTGGARNGAIASLRPAAASGVSVYA